MLQFKLLLILSTRLSSVLSFIESSSDGISQSTFNQVINPTESYIGPSSYATSFQSNNHDYPAFGNFGYLMDVKNPQITSAYSSFGPSENNEFSSTSYINYPSTSTSVQQIHDDFKNQNSPPHSSYTSVLSHDTSALSHDTSALPPNLSSLFSSPANQEVPISQHIEITKPVAVPVYKKFPYAVPKRFPVAIPHPVLVPVPAPYPVNVLVSEPVAVPVIKEIKVPVEREIMYPVEKNVPVEVEKPVQFYVEKHFPVYVNKPYPVKIPIVKTVIHKTPRKWSREEEEANKRSEKFKKLLTNKTFNKYQKLKRSFNHNQSKVN